MAGTTAKLYRGAPTATAAPAITYTVPVGTKTILTEIIVSNVDGSSSELDVYLVAAGGAPAISNALVLAMAFAGRTITIFTLHVVLLAGETIHMRQSVANALTLHISGVENAP